MGGWGWGEGGDRGEVERRGVGGGKLRYRVDAGRR